MFCRQTPSSGCYTAPNDDTSRELTWTPRSKPPPHQEPPRSTPASRHKPHLRQPPRRASGVRDILDPPCCLTSPGSWCPRRPPPALLSYLSSPRRPRPVRDVLDPVDVLNLARCPTSGVITLCGPTASRDLPVHRLDQFNLHIL